MNFGATNDSFKNESNITSGNNGLIAGINEKFNSSSSPIQIHQFQEQQQQNPQFKHLEQTFLPNQFHHQPEQQALKLQGNYNLTVSSSSNNSTCISKPNVQNRTPQQCYNSFGYSVQPELSMPQTMRNQFDNNGQRNCLGNSPVFPKPPMMYSFASPLSSPSYFQQFSRPQMPECQMSPGIFPSFSTKEQQFNFERYRLMQLQAQYKSQMSFPYPLPGISPTHPMGMSRFPHPNMLMSPPNMFMTPNGPAVIGPNNQLIPIAALSNRPFNFPLVHQQCMMNINSNDALTDSQKKESKKKATKITKKQQTLQQQQAEAEIARRQQEFTAAMSGTLQNVPLPLSNGNISTSVSRFSQQLYMQQSASLMNEAYALNQMKGICLIH